MFIDKLKKEGNNMPLRPELYDRLNRIPRLGGVIIAHEGESMAANVETVQGRPRLQFNSGGEEYRVNCFACSDTRHRLWINHLWGLYHPVTRSRHLWLCNCFNENCVANHERQLALYNLVFDDTFNRGQDVLRPGEAAAVELAPAELPGTVVLLDQLPPDHHASQFVLHRGFDPIELARHLGVGYRVDSLPQFGLTHDRIIIPIYMYGRLVGWQARYIGEPPELRIPKYYTMPGLKKRGVLYNFDIAKNYPFVVVCEGVTDVWRVGPRGVALLGKNLSTVQKQLLAAHWGGGAVIVMLDGDATDEAQGLYDALAGLVRHRIMVSLPDGKDPGDFPRDYLEQAVLQAASQQGVDLPSLSR